MKSEKDGTRTIAIIIYTATNAIAIMLVGWGAFTALDPWQNQSQETACKDLYLDAAHQLQIKDMESRFQSFTNNCSPYLSHSQIENNLSKINAVISNKSPQELVPVIVRDAALETGKNWSSDLEYRSRSPFIFIISGAILWAIAKLTYSAWRTGEY